MKPTTIDMHPKTILVTGAAGFIGSRLVERLLRGSHCSETGGGSRLRVIGVDNMNHYYDMALKEQRLKPLLAHSGFTFVHADIADRDAVGRIFDSCSPDNLAAQAGVRYSIDSPESYIHSNIIGFFNILEAARHSYDHGRHGVEHLVYASSSSVYGMDRHTPFSTSDPIDSPVSLYAATKKSDELMAHAYAKLYDIPCTGLRFFTVYGPAGRPDMAYFSFAEKWRRGDKIQLYNYGRCRRDFTYIDDIVEGIVQVMAHAPARCVGSDGLPLPPYRIYNIGNGHPESLLTFVHTLCDELVRAGALPSGFDLDSHCVLAPMQPGDVVETYADTAPLEHDLGYRPTTPLGVGLRRFAEWFAANRTDQPL